MKESKKSVKLADSCPLCESCEERFEENIQEIISEATPPTIEQHKEREEEVRDSFISQK